MFGERGLGAFWSDCLALKALASAVNQSGEMGKANWEMGNGFAQVTFGKAVGVKVRHLV